MLINTNITTYNGDLCDHEYPVTLCKSCKIPLVNKMDIHKDLKTKLINLLPNIEKYVCHLVKGEKDNDDTGCYRTYLSMGDTDYGIYGIGKVNFYFYDCHEEFIFGFLSLMSWIYFCHNDIYKEKFRNRIQYELSDEITMKDMVGGTIMTSYNGDAYFIAYMTLNPNEFRKGWDLATSIKSVIPINRYYSRNAKLDTSKYIFNDLLNMF